MTFFLEVHLPDRTIGLYDQFGWWATIPAVIDDERARQRRERERTA